MPYLVYSEPGYAHANEDVVQVQALDAKGETLLCALADGQGGQSGGAEAAKCAVKKSLETAATFGPEALLNERTWRGIVSAADKAVEETPNAGFTTLVCIALHGNRLCGASCGDGAALLLNDGQEYRLTQNQIKNPPIGSSAAQSVAFSAALGSTWKLLIMSDGVWKYAGWERIGELMRRHQGQELIDALREAVAGGWGGKLPDDFTLALFEQGT